MKECRNCQKTEESIMEEVNQTRMPAVTLVKEASQISKGIKKEQLKEEKDKKINRNQTRAIQIICRAKADIKKIFKAMNWINIKLIIIVE